MGELVRQGRPLKLLDEGVRERLLEAIVLGASVETAAAFAGISPATFYSWMNRGRRAAEEAAEGGADAGEVEASEAPFVEFLEAVTRARARGEFTSAQLLRQIAQGGYPLRSRTRRYRDPATGQLVEETETDLAPPNLRAVIFYLERRHPATWGRNATPADQDQPEEDAGHLYDHSRLKALAERIHRNVAQYRAELTAGDHVADDHEDDVPPPDGHVAEGARR